ncbi:ABC transporter ATP-binding protein [Treponema rectale]|uniref:ABC transporter ATP-binding protein n=1 Tax=Treponema rectale TaxID=744512 RepID=A0A840SFH7_9SPIR|nr:ABC transporter ATP-binding protein [Treponema rectale]MBB5218908.1 oligopeptide transport system ATP-binding protein [Treponema rectale]QOS41177.1 ABC transporter ATP-binding protein [Treponema rectale]
MNEVILSVKNLTVNFRTNSGTVHAVRNISFDLFKGQTLAIVGESGSGKSVTSKAILGIESPNAEIPQGEIIFENENLLKFSEKDFNKIRGNKIAMIFQDPMSSLDPIVKIGKQITEAIIINAKKNFQKISKKEAYQKAISIMTEVGIPEPEKRFNQYPFEFSGGMRQRIVIAIAISSNPEILICDEPTTALDVTIQSQILQTIKRLKKERNMSVIFITHDLGVVANVADSVAVMYAGKIVEYGTSREIFYNSKHPYTWALLSSIPDPDSDNRLESIPGTPPDMRFPPEGDAFAPRNKYAMEIDFEREPPFFKVSPTHYAATWLLHPDAPEVELPLRIKQLQQKGNFHEQ